MRSFLFKLFAFCFFYCLGNFLFAQDSLNMIRLTQWDDDSLPVGQPFNIQYSGCWGLVANGREIAVVGGALHVLFFDITEPTTPVLIGKFAGEKKTIWREFKSYKNRVYAVSDQTEEGLMIFDCSLAPDTIIRTYYSDTLFDRAHTITLDTASGRIYLNGSNSAIFGLLVLDVSVNPDSPTVVIRANNLPGEYVHDSYVRGDTVYASCGYSGFFVYDFTDPSSVDNIKTIGYAYSGGYNHNSWITTDGRFAYYTEEIPSGQPVRIVDLTNLGDFSQGLEIVGSILDSFALTEANTSWRALPHNVFIKDSLLFVSQYEDGLLVYNIADPVAPVLIGHYDTHPQNIFYSGYAGNWGNYPWLPSGNIIAADMQNGLQVLKLLQPPSTAVNQPSSLWQAKIYPNPVSDELFIHLPAEEVSDGWILQIFNGRGEELMRRKYSAPEQRVETSALPSGIHWMKITAKSSLVRPFMKVKE